jgi:hypothetical protein
MTPAEREALLSLWNDVPECRPKGLHVGERGAWWCDTDGPVRSVYEPHAAAIARDAMVGWMISQSMRIGMKCVLGAKLFDGTSVQYSAWNHGPNGRNQGQGDGDTLLLALVATCRKIAGKDSA